MKKPPRWLSTPLLFLILLTVAPLAQAYYDPGIQRWINRDPIAEGGVLNLSSFVLNNAVNRADGFGNWIVDTGGVPGSPDPDHPREGPCEAEMSAWLLTGAALGVCLGISAVECPPAARAACAAFITAHLIAAKAWWDCVEKNYKSVR